MTKSKLTDAQRVVLAAAGARDTGLVFPLSKSLAGKREALESELRDLLSQGLVSERTSLPGEAAWAVSEDGERRSLVITAAGLDAVGLGAGRETPVADANRKLSKTKAAPLAKRRSTPKSKSPSPSRKADAKGSSTKGESAPRRTKLDLLVGALRQKKGATIQEMMDATGWQAHSVRGVMSGALKKRMELNVASSVIEGRGRVYRIEGEDAK